MATGQVRTEIELLEFFKDNVNQDIYPVDLRDFVATMFFEIAAITGVSSYVYIAYADDAAGTGFTTSFNATKEWIAIRSTTTEILSPVVGDFAGLWTKYIGDKGDPGTSLLTGIVDPLPGDGADGDSYLNIASYDIFGPKSGGVWGSGTSIIGNGIASIVLQGTVGLVDTYRMTFTDATFIDYNVTNGNGIASIVLQGTVGLVDTYRITFDDASFFDYTVTNGAPAPVQNGVNLGSGNVVFKQLDGSNDMEFKTIVSTGGGINVNSTATEVEIEFDPNNVSHTVTSVDASLNISPAGKKGFRAETLYNGSLRILSGGLSCTVASKSFVLGDLICDTNLSLPAGNVIIRGVITSTSYVYIETVYFRIFTGGEISPMQSFTITNGDYLNFDGNSFVN